MERKGPEAEIWRQEYKTTNFLAFSPAQAVSGFQGASLSHFTASMFLPLLVPPLFVMFLLP